MAELLVMAQPRGAGPFAWQVGDVVAVMPDGHVWSDLEGAPTFARVSLPGVPPDECRAMAAPRRESWATASTAALRRLPALARAVQSRERTVTGRRRLAVDLAALGTAQTGAATVPVLSALPTIDRGDT